jgi:hypothetical protein
MRVRLLRPELDLVGVQWLDGGVRVIDPTRHGKAVVEDVQMGSVKVAWLTQVQSVRDSLYNDGTPMETMAYSVLRRLSCFSHTWWTLGDRALYHKDVDNAAHWKTTDWAVQEGKINTNLHEVIGLETTVDVRWQDGTVEEGVPSSGLSMCNPDQYAFFPLEIVTRTEDEEANYEFTSGYQNATTDDADRATMVHSQRAAAMQPGSSTNPISVW